MTNDRVQRIIDVPAEESAAGSIAPPPIDRADDESQLEDYPDASAAPSDDLDTATDPTADLTPTDDEDTLPEGEPADPEAAGPDAVAATEFDAAVEVGETHEATADATDAHADVADGGDTEADAPTEALPQLLEALLFVADEPVASAALARALGVSSRHVRRGLDDLGDALREQNRGVRLQVGPDGAQLVTAPEAATAVETFLGLEANRRLSNAALETLAIIAYRQPVTRHVIEQIRGVSSDGAVATLRARGLIEGIGRAPGPGRPLLFSTTQRFLEHFGLERPDELPPLPPDVELPPEEGQGPPLALDLTGVDEVDDVDDEVSDIEDEERDAADRLDTDDDAPVDALNAVDHGATDEFDELDELDDGPDLEISDDLDDLSRAAGLALSAAPDSADSAATLD